MASLLSKLPSLPGQLITLAKPKLATFMYYAKVEMKPPTPGEFGEIKAGFGRILNGAKTGKWKELTVKEAWLNTLVFVEVGCWFFIGEIIGRGNLVGYNIRSH